MEGAGAGGNFPALTGRVSKQMWANNQTIESWNSGNSWTRTHANLQQSFWRFGSIPEPPLLHLGRSDDWPSWKTTQWLCITTFLTPLKSLKRYTTLFLLHLGNMMQSHLGHIGSPGNPTKDHGALRIFLTLLLPMDEARTMVRNDLPMLWANVWQSIVTYQCNFHEKLVTENGKPVWRLWFNASGSNNVDSHTQICQGSRTTFHFRHCCMCGQSGQFHHSLSIPLAIKPSDAYIPCFHHKA